MTGEPVISINIRECIKNGEKNPTRANTNSPFEYVLEAATPEVIGGMIYRIYQKGIILTRINMIK